MFTGKANKNVSKWNYFFTKFYEACLLIQRSESHGSGNNRHTDHYTGREDHVKFELVFLARQGNQDAYMEVGEFSYPFEFVLPPNIPTSFEHSIGRTRYSIDGTIDIPWYIFWCFFFKLIKRKLAILVQKNYKGYWQTHNTIIHSYQPLWFKFGPYAPATFWCKRFKSGMLWTV